MQEHSAAPNPYTGPPVHSSSPAHLHHHSDYVHAPPPSVQMHSNPNASPPPSHAAAPHAHPSTASQHPSPSTTVPDSYTTHEFPADTYFAEPNNSQSMGPAQGQRLRREDRNDAAAPKHRIQRQAKTPRPFYEEPVGTR